MPGGSQPRFKQESLHATALKHQHASGAGPRSPKGVPIAAHKGDDAATATAAAVPQLPRNGFINAFEAAAAAGPAAAEQLGGRQAAEGGNPLRWLRHPVGAASRHLGSDDDDVHADNEEAAGSMDAELQPRSPVHLRKMKSQVLLTALLLKTPTCEIKDL